MISAAAIAAHVPGSDTWTSSVRSRLDALCADLNDLPLRDEGRAVDRLVRPLVNRYRLRNAPQAAPAVVVIGLARTGTTLLYELAARCGLRAPTVAEARWPLPLDPVAAAHETRAYVRAVWATVEGIRSVHDVREDASEECSFMLEPSLLSDSWSAEYPLHRYGHVVAQASAEDRSEAWGWVDRTLGALDPRARWVVKDAAHLSHLGVLLDRYPETRFVWTVRDLATASASCASLIAREFQATVGALLPDAALGPAVLERNQRAVAAASPFAENERVTVVEYDDLVSAPQAVVSRLGLAWTAEAQQWLDTHPQHLHGEHTYSIEQYGVCHG